MEITGSIVDKIKRAGLTIALVAVMGVSLAACGGDTGTSGNTGTGGSNTATTEQPTATTAQAPTAEATMAQPTTDTGAGSGSSSAGSQEEKVSLVEWGIAPKDVEVKAGKVKFVVTNDGQFTHNLAVSNDSGELGKTPNFKKDGGPQTLELDLKPGTYKLLCDIPGHASKGMMGTLVVK